MSNYPNMSYCMNENTLAALEQVLTAMQEQGPEFLKELSPQELRAFNELYQTCEAFMLLAEELQSEVDNEDDYDGQPDESQEWYDFNPEA